MTRARPSYSLSNKFPVQSLRFHALYDGDDPTEILVFHERPSSVEPVNQSSIGTQYVFDILLTK